MTRKLWTVFLVLLALALVGGGGYLFLRTWPLLAPTEPLPTITVEAVYPGASAQVVADTIAAPIEQQICGVERLVSLRSQCTDDGRYTLRIRFERGFDANVALVLVQNRVTLALPVLPDLVQRQGVTVQKKSPQAVLFVVLSSPDDKYDAIYLNNYATIFLKDELARAPGVGDVAMAGPQEDKYRIRLDLQRLETYKLTAADVTRALKQQNLEVEPGLAGRDLQFVGLMLGRLTDPEQLSNVIVRAGAGAGIVRLRDVARIELGGNAAQSQAWLNGKPVVALAVYPLPQTKEDVVAAVHDKLAQLRPRLPDGLDLQVGFELAHWPTTAEYLRVDLTLPDANAERTVPVVKKCAAVVRDTPGVQDTLVLCGRPFALGGNQACILVRLAKDRETSRAELMQTLRSALEETVPQAAVRLCDVSSSTRFPLGGYAIDLAIIDTGGNIQPPRQLAEKLVERLRQSGKLMDVGLGRGAASVPQIEVTVDRDRAMALGVATSDILDVLQVWLGPCQASELGLRTWQVQAPLAAGSKLAIDDIKQLKVRNVKGEMVSLTSLVTVRRVEGPEVIERLDLCPAIGITANPAAGVSVSEARILCESLAEELRKELGLQTQCRLIWVQD